MKILIDKKLLKKCVDQFHVHIFHKVSVKVMQLNWCGNLLTENNKQNNKMFEWCISYHDMTRSNTIVGALLCRYQPFELSDLIRDNIPKHILR